VDETIESFDWREKGGVNEVKDQGVCGASWAFVGASTVEGAWFAKGGELVSLSEQQLIDCAGSNSCYGGSLEEAFEYYHGHGAILEENYGYDGKQGDCR